MHINRRTAIKAGLAAGSLSFASSGIRAQNRSDVIVIGAGLSGLNATLLLEEFGVKVTLLEGTNRIGGRLYTAPEKEVPGHPEIGGSGIGDGYARLLDSARKFGVKFGPIRHRTTVATPDDIMYHVYGEGILRSKWGEHPRNPFTDEQARNMPPYLFQYSAYSASNPLPRGDVTAWQDPQYAQHDISVYELLRSKGVPDAAIHLGAGTNMSYGSNAYDLSAMMWYQITTWFGVIAAAGDGGYAALGGNQRIPEAMAQNVATEIRNNEHVVGIRSAHNGVEVHTASGNVYRAKFVINTTPYSALRLVNIDPGFEGNQADAVKRLGYTPVFQVHFVPTRKFWEEDGLPPSMWTDRSVGRFMALKNDPASPDDITSYLAFVNGDMAKFMDRLPQDQAVSYMLRELAEMRPSTRGALRPVKVWSWNRNVFAGGAYAYWKPGQITSFARDLAKPWHRIHFAGEHTSATDRGMEGAMQSGERVAIEVMSLL